MNSSEITKNMSRNFRVAVFDLGLQTVSKLSDTNCLNTVEIGCMFKANEGFSTYRIALFLKQYEGQKSFTSIDNDPEHIQSCKQMFIDLNPELLANVKFSCGKSLEMLPGALDEIQSVDFVLLDGGGGPECCLGEFELVIRKLSKNGLIIIDDSQEMAASPAYPSSRPFGKATLIYPYLIIAEYLRFRDNQHAKSRHSAVDSKIHFNSDLVTHSSTCKSLELLKTFNYIIVSKDSHKMTLVGNSEVIEIIKQKLKNMNSKSILISPIGSIVNTPTKNLPESTGTNTLSISPGLQKLSSDDNTTAVPKSLDTLRNLYVGRRAFIIGNGPSLKFTDLTKLKDEITFGVNSIFYNFDSMGFKPTFYVVEDKLVAEDRADEINNLTGMTKIFGTYLNYCLKDNDDVIWANVIFDYRQYPGFPNFSKNASECLWVGGTVTYLCMQLANYMGFEKVYLIGFDHNYTIPKDASIEGNVITSATDDPNHFHPEYFGKGKRWHDPRLDRMEMAYKRAKETFNADGRGIYNATVGGKLEIFPRVDYESIFSQKVVDATTSPNQNLIEVNISENNNKKVRFSVIICTHQNPQLLRCAIESLLKQTLSSDLFEIIVVDNNSHDNTADVVANYPSVRYVLEENLGLSYARNAGISAARGEIIAFIDDDAEASPGWAEDLLRVYDSVPNVWAIGGNVLPIWDTKQPVWLTEEHHGHLSLRDYGNITRSLDWPKEGMIGTNCSFRKEVFSTAGCFDVNLGRIGAAMLAFEDADIQRRIIQNGHFIYYTNATVYHHVPAKRMTKEYFNKRALGNTISEMFIDICQAGNEQDVRQFVDLIRDVWAEFTDMSSYLAEEQIMENAFTKFVRGHFNIPVEIKSKFIAKIGIYYTNQKRYEDALSIYNEGLSLPELPGKKISMLLALSGNVYLEQELYEKAEQKFNESLSLGEFDEEMKFHVLKGLGICYGQNGQFDRMEKNYDEILVLAEIPESDKVDAIRAFGQCYFKHQKYKEAEYVYLRMLGQVKGKNRYQMLKGLGISYAAQSRYTEMKSKLDEILNCEAFSEDRKIDAVLCFSRYYLENKNYQQAEQLYSRILDKVRGKERYQVLKGLGDCLGALGKHAEMEQKFDEILSLSEVPDELKINALLSFCRHYFEAGMAEPAEKLYSKVYLLNNLDNFGRYHLILGYGIICLKYGSFYKAKEKFDEAVSIEGINPKDKFWSLSAYVKLDLTQDRFSKAQQQYQELFFSNTYTNRQKAVLASDFVNYHAAKGNREKIIEIYKQVCSLKDITLEDKSLFAHRVKEALQHVQNNPQQNVQQVIQEHTDKQILISVIVCTYRNPELLAKTLDSLNRQTLNQNLFEIIVVNNNSQDSTPNVVSRYPSARYVQEQKQGLSCARNTGIQQSKSDIIAFIDDDAEASPGWLEALLHIYDNNPQVWAVGGKVLPIWDTEKPQWLNESYYRALSLLDWGEIEKPLQWPERIIGANCSFRKEVFSSIGLFNTRLGRISNALLASEEIEIQERIHSLSRQVYYTPQAVVYHHVPASRMSREHFYHRRLGNILSLTIKSLLSQGKTGEVETLINHLTNTSVNVSNEKENTQNIVSTLRQALELLHKSPDECLAEVKGYIQTAADAIRRCNWEVAETFLRTCIDIQPKNPDAYSTLCTLYEAQGDIEAANKVRREAMELFPGHTAFSGALKPDSNTTNVTFSNAPSFIDKQASPCHYLFAASNDSHVGWMLPIAEQLESSRFMVFPAKNENAEFYLQKNQKQFIQYHPGILKTINPSVIVFGCDWGGNEQQTVQEAKAIGIPTVCIQEGCLDFQNQQVRRMTRANYAFLQGPIMRKYIQRQDNIIVTGNPKYDSLYEIPLPEKVTVMINSNFTYGIYEEARDHWVHDVAESCKEMGLDFFISQHPRDTGVFPPEYRLVKSDAFKMQQQLRDTSILVSRFSTVIYEALAMGREVIYYNPHREHFRIFAEDDTGGILIANNLSELTSAIDSTVKCLGGNNNKKNFLLQHCATLNHDAAKNCAENLRAIAQKRIRPDATTHLPNAIEPEIYPIRTFKSETNNPLVSVIIPAYNAAEHIAESLKSVLAQSYRNFELFIINDGSTDQTEKIILGYKDPRIRYHRQENRGLAATHNLGIKQSRGEFIIKLDADDMMTPDFIDRHINEFEKHPEADLVYCDDCLIDVDGRQIQIIEYPEYSERKTLIRDLFRSGYTIVPFRTCIRKSVFEKIGFFDENLVVGEDYDMMRRFAKHGLKIHHLRSALYQRRMGMDSLSRNYTQSKADNLYEILKRYVDTFTYDELFPDVAWENIDPEKRQLHGKCFVAATYLSMGELHINTNSSPIYIKKAFEHAHSELKECLELDPNNQQIRQLIQKCTNGLQQYNKIIPQTVGSNYKG